MKHGIWGHNWMIPVDLDLECKNLCIALNALPGIETEDSCCGHGEEMYHIWFRVKDYTQRGFLFLSRMMSRNYYPFSNEWQITVEHSDITGFTRKGGWHQIMYLLEGPPGSYTWDGKPEGGFADAEKMAEIIERHISKKELGYNLLYHTVDNKPYDEYWERGKNTKGCEIIEAQKAAQAN
jgi:hypothetical protein